MVVVRNLSPAHLKTNLIVMSPVSLLFSSDEESSRRLVQALRELELEIEPCPDIFTAVEWLTSRSFDVIVADWDSGPEAAFLLKNSRELKLNKAAFTLALSSGTSNLASEPDGPDLVLIKPLIPDQVKYALLSNDRFLGCLRAWVARGDFSHPRETDPSGASAADTEVQRPQPQQPSPTPLGARPVEPSPDPGYSYGTAARLNLTFATLDRRLFRSRNRGNPGEHGSGEVKRYRRNRVLWGSVLSLAFVSVGYIFGQPLRVQSVFASVATAYKQALQTESSKRRPTESNTSSDSAALAQTGTRRSAALFATVRGVPFHSMLLPDQIPTAPAETPQVEAHLNQDRLPVAASRVLIPESLTVPQPEAASVRTVSLRRSPSLLSQVEPVSLSEDLSRALLLQKVTPGYPEQALKAGLQGAVILQAWIGKDGNIRDLKLVDGSLLLGQAAVKAVKQWRYKPYLRNGVAVEAETYVTVNFRLP
jgi:TonB family protein